MKFMAIGLAVVLAGGVFLGAGPADGKKSVLIVYGSRYGSTEQTAKWIAEGLAGRAMVAAAKDVADLGDCEKLVLGSGIYGDDVHADMNAFLERNGAAVKEKLVALFVVCGTPPAAAGGYLEMFAGKCGVKPPLLRAFPGWQKKERLSAEDYKGLESYYKSQNYPFEDYDHTDKAACIAFGKEILATLD